MRIGRAGKIILIAALAVVALPIYIRFFSGPSLRKDGLVRASMSYRYFPETPKDGERGQYITLEGSTEDAGLLGRFLAVANAGRRTIAHKCMGYGEVVLHYKDGTTRTLGFLLGHHEDSYELAEHGAFYRVDRVAFREVAGALGIDREKLPP